MMLKRADAGDHEIALEQRLQRDHDLLPRQWPPAGAVLSALPSQTAFATEHEAARQLLGVDDEKLLVVHDSGARIAAVLAKLMELSDRDVLRILAVVMAETLASGTALIDTLTRAHDLATEDEARQRFKTFVGTGNGYSRSP